MTYAVKQDMIDRFGEQELIEVTDRANAVAIDDQVLGVALADADATINSYIEARYSVPPTPVPHVLVSAAAKLARYQLHDDGASEQIAADRTQVLAWLKDVSRGLARLGDDDAATPDPTATLGPVVTSPDRPSIEDGMEGY